MGLGFRKEARLSGPRVWAHPLWRAVSSLCSGTWSGYPGKGEEAAGTGHQEAFLPPGELRKGAGGLQAWWRGTELVGHDPGGVRLSGGMGAPRGFCEPAASCPESPLIP